MTERKAASRDIVAVRVTACAICAAAAVRIQAIGKFPVVGQAICVRIICTQAGRRYTGEPIERLVSKIRGSDTL